MTTQCTFFIHPAQNILDIHDRLKQHITIFQPPYTIPRILEAYVKTSGKKIKVIICHTTRDVQVIEHSIAHHILQTTVSAFQRHRLSYARARPEARLPFLHDARASNPTSQPGLPTKKECPICFDKIGSKDGCALPCAHSFHQHCIQHWLQEKNTCPVCRTNII